LFEKMEKMRLIVEPQLFGYFPDRTLRIDQEMKSDGFHLPGYLEPDA